MRELFTEICILLSATYVIALGVASLRNRGAPDLLELVGMLWRGEIKSRKD